MNKLTAIKIKYNNGTYSDEIPVSTFAEHIVWDSSHTLIDILGNVKVAKKGDIQQQIDQLSDEKASITQLNNSITNLQNYVDTKIDLEQLKNIVSSDITDWLERILPSLDNLVEIDDTLSIRGKAADAKVVGDYHMTGAEANLLAAMVENSSQTGYTENIKQAVDEWLEEYNRTERSTKVYNHSTVIFETAKSYLNIAFDPNDRLAYSEGIGLFQPNVTNNGIKSISCSQFVQACLSGISYPFSRYVKDKNEIANWGFLSGGYGTIMPDYGDYLTSNEMGEFFASRNQLHELSHTNPQVKVGDLLLFKRDDSFYHVAFCTGVTATRIYFLQAADKGTMFPEGLPRICDNVEAGVYIRYLNWSSIYAPTHYVSINDIITDTIPINVNKIVDDNEPKDGTYSSSSAFIKSITKDINRGLYTVIIEDNGIGNSNYYLRLNYYKADGSIPDSSQETKYRENVEFIKNQNTFKAIFYAQLDIRRIDIRCSAGTQYGFKKFNMYDNVINY